MGNLSSDLISKGLEPVRSCVSKRNEKAKAKGSRSRPYVQVPVGHAFEYVVYVARLPAQILV
jgi:hypothetical protein